MDKQKVLIIDDDPVMHAVVATVANDLGLIACSADDGEHGLQEALAGDYSLIILDLGLPTIGGLEICRRLRTERPALPVIMLTSRSGEVDKVLGFETGADDYLTKPVSISELTARARALLRRKQIYEQQVFKQTDSPSVRLKFGALTVDLARRKVTRDDEVIDLSALEFDIVAHLASNAGRVIPRDELLTQVWGYSTSATANFDSTLTTNLSRLRMKLEPDPNRPRYILTSRGVGYRFATPAELED